MLFLRAKPDIDEAVVRWKHFWNGELYRRPVVLLTVPKAGVKDYDSQALYKNRYYNAFTGRWNEQLELIDLWLENTSFPGEMMPMFSPDFGPDQWAAFFGAELKFSEPSVSTNWVEPIVDNWEDVLPLEFNRLNTTFRRLLRYVELLAEHGEGRFLVGQIDAHSNADALSALRGAERFMMDLYDCPGLIEQAMDGIRASYKPVHDLISSAGRMKGDRGQGHYGIWHERSFQVVQSDVICMLSPGHFRKYVMPALEEEFSCHEGVYFHLDGPGALKHLDDILSIPGRWILQWQPGDGQKPNWRWPDILKKAQEAGKAVHVFGKGLGFEEMKPVHKQLDPARVIYSPCVEDEAQAIEMINWLEKNS